MKETFFVFVFLCFNLEIDFQWANENWFWFLFIIDKGSVLSKAKSTNKILYENKIGK